MNIGLASSTEFPSRGLGKEAPLKALFIIWVNPVLWQV